MPPPLPRWWHAALARPVQSKSAGWWPPKRHTWPELNTVRRVPPKNRNSAANCRSSSRGRRRSGSGDKRTGRRRGRGRGGSPGRRRLVSAVWPGSDSESMMTLAARVKAAPPGGLTPCQAGLLCPALIFDAAPPVTLAPAHQ